MNYARSLPVIALLLLLMMPAYSQKPSSSSGRFLIRKVIGNVMLARGDSARWFAARPGLSLREKDIIKTHKESQAEIESPEGKILRIIENSVFTISYPVSGPPENMAPPISSETKDSIPRDSAEVAAQDKKEKCR